MLIDSEDEKLTEVEKYVAMKNFQQQLITMRKGPAIVSSSHVYPPHSQPVLHPTVRPTHQRFQNILPGQSNSNVQLNLSRPSHVNIPNSTEKQSNEMEVICLDSDSDSESNNSVPQSQNQPHSLTPVPNSALSSNIMGRNLNTQYENEIVSSKPTSNNPLTQVNTASSSSYSTLSTQLTTPHPISAQTMAPPPMLPGVTSLIKPTTSDASQQGHTPSEAAVAQALAGFVQFQRQLCKQLQDPPGAITQSQNMLKSPAMSQLQLQGQVNPTLSAAVNVSSLSSSCVEPFSHSTVVTAGPTMSPGTHKPNTTIPQLPVKPVLQTSQTSFPLRNCSSQTVMTPCSSNIGQVSKGSSTSAPLYAFVNSLQQFTSGVSLSSPRKAAIVPPISHRPPSTSTQVSSQSSTLTSSFGISTPDNTQAMSSLTPYSSSS